MNHRARLPALTLTALTGALALLSPRVADACGGTFCDGTPGPMQMPVDQTGENILFVSSGNTVEAHIQIQYQGDAPHFAWLLPLQGPAQGDPLPTFSVGSQLLFASLLQSTVPSYGFQPVNISCTKNSPSDSGASATGAGGGASTGGGPHGGGPTVVYQATVGAYDVTLLQGGTIESVMQWLGDNGYQQPPEAEPILGKYLSKGYLFAALKLTNGSGANEIHPLVVTYTGGKPCVPLELTAIAATEDMAVRTFFLGQSRVASTNFMDVELNDLMFDWNMEGADYQQIVSRAVDSPAANGHAFVTEYAGSSGVVSTYGLYSTQWSATPFPTILPVKVVDTLTSQGLMSCSGASCQYFHPLVQGLLQEFLPAPAGLAEDSFYSCLACYKTQIDMAKWDGAKFGQAMIERVIAPGKHAQDVLQQNPYLTRLFTTISPAEMTEDPDFAARTDLPDVSSQHIGTRTLDCANCTTWSLPDSNAIVTMKDQPAGTWPTWSSSMPYARAIRQMTDGGPALVLVDNATAINDELLMWNAAHMCDPSASGNTQGQGGATYYGPGAGGAGGATRFGVTSSSDCSIDGAPGGAARWGVGFLGLLMALGVGARRRKQS